MAHAQSEAAGVHTMVPPCHFCPKSDSLPRIIKAALGLRARSFSGLAPVPERQKSGSAPINETHSHRSIPDPEPPPQRIPGARAFAGLTAAVSLARNLPCL